jgi:anti-sigma regulatory factor (Ser/Thr protein kinase)
LAVTSDGMARFLEGPSSVPLGVMSYPAYEAAETEMPLGGTVLLYTDGLVERPGELLDRGLDRLSAAVRGERVGPQRLCDHVVEQLVPAAGASDDVALLALCSPQLCDSFELELGSEPGELASMRALLRRWLRHAESDDVEIAEILTATGEAAANAIEHGGSITGGPPFEVTGRLDDGEVEIVVRDSGGWRRRQRSEGGRGLVLMRALMDSVEVDPGVDGTTVRMRRRIGAVTPAAVGDRPA